mgnify:CR=1 FL=1
MSGNGLRRRDNATGLLPLAVLLIVLSPVWLVILLGLGVLYVGNAGSFTAALATVPVPLVSIIAFLYPALVAVLSVRFVRRLEGRRHAGEERLRVPRVGGFQPSGGS